MQTKNLGYGRIGLSWDDATGFLRMSVDNAPNIVNLKGNVSIPFSFGIDGDGNYGYYGADGSLIPFRSTILKETVNYELTGGGNTYTHTFSIPKGIKNALLILTIATSYSCDVNILGSENLVGEVQTDYGYLCPQKYYTRTIVEKLSVVNSNAGECVLKLTHSEETITNYVTIASMNFLY